MNYISSDSYKINEKLRTGAKLSDQEKDLVHHLDSVLNKTKNYKGNVNRSVNFMYQEDVEKFVSQHSIGCPIFYKHYISSTTDLVYNEDAQVQIHILSKHGKDIRKYNQRENEILFKRDAKFYVTNIQKSDDVWSIWLEEE